MKTLFVTAIGAVMLITGGIFATSSGNPIEASAQKAIASPSYKNGEGVKEITADIKKLPEYKTLAKKVDLSRYSPRITEDNMNKRVIILKDGNNRDRFKSVFVKKENRLKVVDYRGGLIFNGIIEVAEGTQVAPEAKPSVSNTIAQLPEYKTLAASTDLSGYSAHVVEDNRNKRIILFKDADGHSQYKTIYVKKTGLVKVINL